MSIFTGAGVALITPMNPDGSINYPEMEHISTIRSQVVRMRLLCVEQLEKRQR